MVLKKPPPAPSLEKSEGQLTPVGHKNNNEDYARLEKLFNSLDVNGDGRIDVNDLTSVLRHRGDFSRDEQKRAEFAKKFLDKSDLDSSGDVTLEEFIEYAKTHEKKLKLIFTNIDRNRDGKIDLDEVMKVCKEQLGVGFSDENQVKRIFSRMGLKDGEYLAEGGSNSLEISWEDWRDYLILTPHVDSLPDLLKYWRHATYLDVGEDTVVPDDFTAQEMQTGMWWRHLVAGGIAGAVSRTSTAPLDRIKLFLQVHGKSSGGLLSCLNGMIKEGGISSLWRGNWINVLKIAPESAFKFMAYEQGKRLIKGDSNAELRIEERFIAGSLAGAISQSIIYPLEVVKTRLALRRTGQFKGIFDITVKMFRNEGFRVFYRGYIPNLLGILPYAGIDLAVYETLKKHYITKYNSEENREQPGVLVLLSCGTISSACGQIASYPLALVRTRLQASTTFENYSMSGLFRNILQSEGLIGLYRGLMPNFMKVAPAVSISYVVYERVRLKLGVQMT